MKTAEHKVYTLSKRKETEVTHYLFQLVPFDFNQSRNQKVGKASSWCHVLQFLSVKEAICDVITSRDLEMQIGSHLM